MCVSVCVNCLLFGDGRESSYKKGASAICNAVQLKCTVLELCSASCLCVKSRKVNEVEVGREVSCLAEIFVLSCCLFPLLSLSLFHLSHSTSLSGSSRLCWWSSTMSHAGRHLSTAQCGWPGWKSTSATILTCLVRRTSLQNYSHCRDNATLRNLWL